MSPKFGVTWSPNSNLSFRAADTKGLRRALLAGQTIEPTQVAGFSQLFDDSTGSQVRRSGFSIDYKLPDRAFLGVELSERKVRIPQGFTNPILFYDWPEREFRSYW